MKKMILVAAVFFLLSPISLGQEIPNPGFENWTNGFPDGWHVVNSQLYTNIIQSSEAYEGSSSLRNETIELSFPPAPPFPQPGAIWVGSASSTFTIPITQAYTQMTGYYRYYPAEPNMKTGPAFLVTLVDTQNNSAAQGELNLISETVDAWQKFTLIIEYDDPDAFITAAYAQIQIAWSNLDPDFRYVAGSYYLLDNLAFEGAALGISKDDDNIPTEFSLQQNFPNPFNPTTNIKFSIPEESFVNLKIYNVQGEEVATVVNEKLSAGSYQADWDASGLPSGVYVYAIRSENNFQSRKMVLMK